VVERVIPLTAQASSTPGGGFEILAGGQVISMRTRLGPFDPASAEQRTAAAATGGAASFTRRWVHYSRDPPSKKRIPSGG
jgi:hypothetical protein